MKFRTMVLLGGKTATGLPVPGDVVAGLGAGKKPAVIVRVGGHTYRSTIASRGAVFLIPLSAENRAAAGVAAGDEVDVEVELDTAPREVEVPADFELALSGNPEARRRFDGLSYSGKRRYVEPIVQAKGAETRLRRIAKAVDELLG